ncbi:hypothetical protein [Peribacillus saganii]|uniref:hypothetical protein n=1 Tax=Peribacillus saganii TaxID=2303992 RepID=UPI001314A475|nr:hypothetical protein [Peribacillus saganii]
MLESSAEYDCQLYFVQLNLGVIIIQAAIMKAIAKNRLDIMSSMFFPLYINI